MNQNLLVLVGVMVAVGILSALITWFRAEKMSPTSDLASKGLVAVQKSNVVFFGIFMPVLVAAIGFFVYRGMVARSPETAQTAFMALALCVAAVFTILAALVFKMRGFAEFVMLHVIYAAGFGWIYPMLLAR
jgi:uncharacterized membrane protein YobD (UPF0266 family)